MSKKITKSPRLSNFRLKLQKLASIKPRTSIQMESNNQNSQIDNSFLKNQGNHLLKKLANHISAKFQGQGLTTQMIKQSLHSERVNYGRKNNFTMEEDEKIVKYIAKNGKNWVEIAAILNGKTPNMVKNRYYTYLKKSIDQKRQELSIASTSLDQLSRSPDSIILENDTKTNRSDNKFIFEQILNEVKKKGDISKQNEFLEKIREKIDVLLKIRNMNNLLKINNILDSEKKKIIETLENLKNKRNGIKIEEERQKLANLNAIHQMNTFNYLNPNANNLGNLMNLNLFQNQNSFLPQVDLQIFNLEKVMECAWTQLLTLKAMKQ